MKKIDLVVITQTNWCSFHGLLLAKFLDSKLIINECGDYWRQPISYKERIGRHVLRMCDGITTRTQFLKDYILQFHPELVGKIRVIPNSVDLRKYNYKGYDRDKYIFSFFGRLTRAKDPFMILKIAESLRDLHVEFPYEFHLYGKGDMEDDLKQYIHDHRLHNTVQLKGIVHHSEIKNIITQSYLVLMPSVWEPQGRVILESFACGRPILASGVGGMQESLKTDNPFICGSDTSLYVKHIINLVNDKEYYKRTCLENLERSKEFDISKNAQIFTEYFREIAGTCSAIE